jgi:hypothetical protein
MHGLPDIIHISKGNVVDISRKRGVMLKFLPLGKLRD